MAQKKVVFVLGPPGVGKGTQCRKIAERYGFVHISAGELLRKERQVPSSHYGELIDSCIRNGKIVPSDITCKLLERSIETSEKNYFLIDGFPRNEENRDGWTNTMGLLGNKVEVLFVLVMGCPQEICVERCLNRCAAGGSDRSDDTIEILQKRIHTYVKETQPTIDYFADMNLMKLVDGSQPEDAVFTNIKDIFDAYEFS